MESQGLWKPPNQTGLIWSLLERSMDFRVYICGSSFPFRSLLSLNQAKMLIWLFKTRFLFSLDTPAMPNHFSSVQIFGQPHGLQPSRLPSPWDSLGKNTGAGCHALLLWIFPTQGSNSWLPAAPTLQADSLPLSHQGSLYLVSLPIRWVHITEFWSTEAKSKWYISLSCLP